MTTAHRVEWLDAGREPQCAPDPDYPNGKDVDVSMGRPDACKVNLPYPARRCGRYVITCDACRLRMHVTTAGRPDDPRSIKLPCLRGRSDA